MPERKTVVISDLGSALPEDAAVPRVTPDKWQAVPYVCDEFTGTMVIAHGTMRVPDLTLDPGLSGWYRVFTGMLHTVGDDGAANLTGFRLSEDKYPRYFEHGFYGDFARAPYLMEAEWKAADMTGQKVHILHPEGGHPCLSNAAFLKFVPMDDAEVLSELADRENKANKKLIAVHDMHSAFYYNNPQTSGDIAAELEPLAESDAGHVMLEYYADVRDPAFTHNFFVSMDGYGCFTGEGDRFFHTARAGFVRRGEDFYAAFADYAHELGLKVGFSYRMNMFAAQPPWDVGFNTVIYREHPEWRCVDRDGSEIARLSYAFPEVSGTVVDLFRRMLRSGCDGVHLLFCRGVPNLLYEKPLTDAFTRETGLDAFSLAEEDERYIDFRCRYFTENFMIPLKKALTEEAERLGRTEPPFISVHALADRRTNRFFALDLEDWARRGLIDIAVGYPSVMTAPEDFCYNKQLSVDLAFYAGLKSSGIETGADILPRGVSPEEIVRRANQVYDAGLDHVALWDTNSYTARKTFWPVVRRLGHRDLLKTPGALPERPVRYIRVMKMNGLKLDKYNPWWCL